MKRFLYICVCIVLITAFAGCDKGFEVPTGAKIVNNGNETGLAYDLDIEEFTDRFNSIYEAKTGKGAVLDKDNNPTDLESGDFRIIGEKSQKDGKTKYTSYSCSLAKAQIILAVDDESGKIISATTATTELIWSSSAKEVEEIGTAMSIACADYTVENFDYVKEMYEKSISGNCYFDNVIYKVIGTEGTKDNEEMVVKMISLPTKEDYLENVSYTDYRLYKDGKVEFGEHK